MIAARSASVGVVLAAVLALSACASDGSEGDPDALPPADEAARQTCLQAVPEGRQVVSFGAADLGDVRLIARENDQTADPVWDDLPDDHVVAFCSFATAPGLEVRSVVVDGDGRISDDLDVEPAT